MSEYIDLPTIHPVTHREGVDANFYCGPAACSIITGLPAEDFAEWIRRHQRGGKGTHKGVRLTWGTEVQAALVAAGCVVTKENVTSKYDLCFDNITLTEWLRRRTSRTATYLVAAGNHWIVIRGNKAACAQRPGVVSVRKSSKRRGVVTHCYRIRKRPRFQFRLPPFHDKVWDERRQHWRLTA